MALLKQRKNQDVVVVAAVFILLATLVTETDGFSPSVGKRELKDKVWT